MKKPREPTTSISTSSVNAQGAAGPDRQGPAGSRRNRGSSQVRQVLSIAMESRDEGRETAIVTIDWLVARGLNEYAELITESDGG